MGMFSGIEFKGKAEEPSEDDGSYHDQSENPSKPEEVTPASGAAMIMDMYPDIVKDESANKKKFVESTDQSKKELPEISKESKIEIFKELYKFEAQANDLKNRSAKLGEEVNHFVIDEANGIKDGLLEVRNGLLGKKKDKDIESSIANIEDILDEIIRNRSAN